MSDHDSTARGSSHDVIFRAIISERSPPQPGWSAGVLHPEPIQVWQSSTNLRRNKSQVASPTWLVLAGLSRVDTPGVTVVAEGLKNIVGQYSSPTWLDFLCRKSEAGHSLVARYDSRRLWFVKSMTGLFPNLVLFQGVSIDSTRYDSHRPVVRSRKLGRLPNLACLSGRKTLD